MPWKTFTTKLVAYLVAVTTGVVLSALAALGLSIEAEAIAGLETFLAAVYGGTLVLLVLLLKDWWEKKRSP